MALLHRRSECVCAGSCGGVLDHFLWCKCAQWKQDVQHGPHTWPVVKFTARAGYSPELATFTGFTQSRPCQGTSFQLYLRQHCVKNHMLSYGFQHLLYSAGSRKRSRLRCRGSRSRSTNGVLAWWHVWSLDERTKIQPIWLKCPVLPIEPFPLRPRRLDKTHMRQSITLESLKNFTEMEKLGRTGNLALFKLLRLYFGIADQVLNSAATQHH